MRASLRAATLLTTLFVVSLLLVLSLAISSVSVSQLHFTNRQIQGRRALAAAEAVLALAIDRVISNESYGVQNLAAENLEVEVEGAIGYLTFHDGTARQWEVPRSTSNKPNTDPMTGWNGAPIPAQSIQLVAVGKAGGRTKTVEAVLQIPDFPYALASSGPIVSDGGLLIGGVETVDQAISGLRANLLPADLTSNDPGRAIRLNGQADISGDLRAVGAIELGPQVTLRGELQEGGDPVRLEQLDVTSMIPPNSAPYVATHAPVVRGAQHFNQPQLTIRGGLTLDEGIFYVNGDLTVHGGVAGQGALLVNGDVEILDGVALAAENQVALVTAGDVTIRGNGSQGSFFQGLVYTEGDLVAEDVTLLGAFVANRQSTAIDPGSRLSLRDARAVHLGGNASYVSSLSSYTISFTGDQGEYITDSFSISATPFQLQALQTLAAQYNEYTPVPDPALVSALNELGITGEGRLTREGGQSPAEYAAALFRNGFSTITPGGPQTLQVQNPQPLFRFDLNEFLSPASRTRVISWRSF